MGKVTRESLMYALDRICDEAQQRGHKKPRGMWAGPESRAPSEGSYEYVPLNLSQLIPILQDAYGFSIRRCGQHKRSKFLDAGCGIGMTLEMARQIGFWPVSGLELDKTCLTRAKLLFGNRTGILHQNILTYNGYGEYDVIYFYCPFAINSRQVAMEKRIADQMKVGAIVVPVACGYSFLNDRRLRKIRRKRKKYHGPKQAMWRKVRE